MREIAFFDTEVNPNSKIIERLGLLLGDLEDNTSSVTAIKSHFDRLKPKFICGHNFIDHDKKFLSNSSFNPVFKSVPIIDTLYLSMLLFPHKKTHKLEKPYKNELNIENNPLGDARQTMELFSLLNAEFLALNEKLKRIFFRLLKNSEYFSGYFSYINLSLESIDIYEELREILVCSKSEFANLERLNPLELAFVLSFLHTDKSGYFSSVILIRFPKVCEILKALSFKESLVNLKEFAKDEFGFDKFKSFEVPSRGLFDAQEISQEDIIKAGLKDSSFLAVLPTGGGKTFVFWLPALIKAKHYKSLTIVISPLQALMKNHVDSFKSKNQNFKIEAVSGYLNPVERMEILRNVEEGIVDILYLAPEALRSNSVFNAVKGRFIERFVIDEAHCFSAWGHDFRHDYYYIASVIKELETSSFQTRIPISCFTATAKQEVITDIKRYFKDSLNLELGEFIASSTRKNLDYAAIKVENADEKYNALIREISRLGKTPTIIYLPQNAKGCKELSQKLREDPRLAGLDLVIEPFYAKIDDEIESGKREGRNKSQILNDFIENKIDIVIATTAFGMGIDKPDIKAVIHYEQSDSLEAYLQESGRGARSEELRAKCIVIYSQDEFNRSFFRLNNTKIDYAEIERLVKELKKIKQNTIYISPKQLAQKMGLDTEDSAIDYTTIIKTAILELEQAGVLKRGRDSYKIFATSLLSKDKQHMGYVREILDAKRDEYRQIYNSMIMVMQNIIKRSNKEPVEVEELADIVGVERKRIFEVLYALQDEKLIENKNDITINVTKDLKEDINNYCKTENELLDNLKSIKFESKFDLRDLELNQNEIKKAKKIMQGWVSLAKLGKCDFSVYFHKNIAVFKSSDLDKLAKIAHTRQKMAKFIAETILQELGNEKQKDIEITTFDLKQEYENYSAQKYTVEGFHHCLAFLNEILDSFKLKKGRLIYYQAYKIEKSEAINAPRPYQKLKHYNQTLKPYYARKIEALHIQISFLQRLFEHKFEKAFMFAKDYFELDYKKFKSKYNLDDSVLSRPLTKEKFEEILRNLNDEQKAVLGDDKSSSIMVLAGPGSGKTKTLVHKIASLITIENNKPEYFLMLAHSRVAVLEFRDRLKRLIGDQIYNVKIFTFHSFALSLLGKKIKDEKELLSVIQTAANGLNSGEINLPYTQMLVLDEYQDVSNETYEFIKAIFNKMSDDKRIIAVGDDDQCINNFGKNRAEIKFISEFRKDFSHVESQNGATYSLLTNYRSGENLVNFANDFSQILTHRLKDKPLKSHSKKTGKIELARYKDGEYLSDVVFLVKNDNSKSIAVLARDNDEVLAIYSALILEGVKAKYITSKEGFRLGNLDEIMSFNDDLNNGSSIKEATEKMEKKFAKSTNLDIAREVIDRFCEQNEEISKDQAMARVFFGEYIKEIDFDEFENAKTRVVVSTMHKAKGKEFSSVYLCVRDDFMHDEYEKRLIYVAITRAKENLFIHAKGGYFDKFAHNFTSVRDARGDFEPAREISFEMGLGDTILSNEMSDKNTRELEIVAGDELNIGLAGDKFVLTKNGKIVSFLAKDDPSKPNRISRKIRHFETLGYSLNKTAIVKYAVWYHDKDRDKTFIKPLCTVRMRRG